MNLMIGLKKNMSFKSLIKKEKMIIKTIKYYPLILILILSLTSNQFSVAQDIAQPPEKIFSPKQLEMLKTQRTLVKENRASFKKSLSKEQLSIISNKELSKSQRQEALMSSFSEIQKTLLKENRESVRGLKSQFAKSLTYKQKIAIKQRGKNLKERREKIKEYKGNMKGQKDKVKERKENIKNRIKKGGGKKK